MVNRIIDHGFSQNDDRANLEYITRIISADEPILHSVFKKPEIKGLGLDDWNDDKKDFLEITVGENGEKRTISKDEFIKFSASERGMIILRNALDENIVAGLIDNSSEKITSFSEKEFLNADGDVEGRFLLLVTEKNNGGVTSEKDETKNKKSGELITFGISPEIARLISDFMHTEYLRDSNKFTINDLSVSKNYAAMLADFTSEEEKIILHKRLGDEVTPVELKNSLSVPERAAFYSRDPLTGVRTEILIRLHREKYDNSDIDTFIYLKPTEKKNIYSTYKVENNKVEQLGKNVFLNEETLSWHYEDTPKEESIEIDFVEGNKQVELYGRYYNAKMNGKDKYVIEVLRNDGVKREIPLYQEPLSKK
ncbi:hypothetical protein LU631_08600 [Erwinia tracheiphila]|nr:hypothetical protein [Erwinia tracheiphila]UIA89275.1 hypothetical protein LU631_08600 [Erwinia tracheiphila]UIA97658.1 hypothetical protein LU633_07285 [Erwinia tracheiphila]